MPQTKSKAESSASGGLHAEAAAADQSNGVRTPASNISERRDHALREVQDFLAGRAPEASRIDPAEKDVRSAVLDELLSVVASDSQAIRSSQAGLSGNGNTLTPDTQEQATDAGQAAQDRARQLFMDHGYFDEAVDRLQNASLPGERADAARTIGRLGNRVGNVPLIAALFDDEQEVRDAATAALAEMGDSSAAAAASMPSGSEESVASAPLVKQKLKEVPAPASLTPEVSTTEVVSGGVSNDESVPADEAKLLLDEAAARKTLEELKHRLDDTSSSRIRLEKEAALRLESEARLSAEAAARRREEEEVRQRAEEEAAQRRREEDQKLAAAHSIRIKTEEEALGFAQEDARLRLEVGKLRLAAEEIARTRVELQIERATTAERARLAETQRARRQAEKTHKAEMKRLRSEEEALQSALAETALRRTEVQTARDEANQATLRLAEEREQLEVVEAARQAEAERLREAEETARAEQEQLLQEAEEMRRVAEEAATRRAEVEDARARAAEEAQQLLEAQARMKAAEAERQEAEAERIQIEAELIQKAEEERRLLEEVRMRAEQEKQRLEAEERYRTAEQEQRLAQLAAMRQQIDQDVQERAEKERQLNNQIESLRAADMQARKRIEDAEGRRRTVEEHYRLVAEKVQRVEAESRKSEIAEAQVLAKLEVVRRNVAVATQSAAEQEKRVREETEQLLRLEEELRQRIEGAVRIRAEAEQRLQQGKEQLQAEEEARARASEELDRLTAPAPAKAAEEAGEWHDDPSVNLRPSPATVLAEPQTSFIAAPASASPYAATASAAAAPESVSSLGTRDMDSDQDTNITNEQKQISPGTAAGTALAPVAAVSAQDDFSRITNRFDDPSSEIRIAAAIELREMDPLRMVESFTRALDEAPAERRVNIARGMAASGLAAEVIDMLGGESREETYSALCLLLAMAKTGEVQPLVRAIETHDNVYVRIAAVRLLTLNGQEEIANAAARRRLEGSV